MSSVNVAPDQEQAVKSEALTVIDTAKAIAITNQSSYDDAAKMLVEVVKPMRTKWYERIKVKLVEPAYRAYKANLDFFNEVDKPLETAERDLKEKIGKWDSEQERIRRENELRLQKEAEEQERIAREQSALAAIEESGSDEEAEAAVAEIMSMPAVIPTPVAAPTYERNSAVSVRKAWVAELVSMEELCKAIGSGRKDLANLVEFNVSAANNMAKAQRSAMNVPGVRAAEKSIVAGRSK